MTTKITDLVPHLHPTISAADLRELLKMQAVADAMKVYLKYALPAHGGNVDYNHLDDFVKQVKTIVEGHFAK